MKTRTSFKYFVHDSLWRQFFVSNSPHSPSKYICVTVLVTLGSFLWIVDIPVLTKDTNEFHKQWGDSHILVKLLDIN